MTHMIPSLSIGSRTLLNDCNHSATAIFGGQQYTAFLSKLPHSNCCKIVPNRPLRPRRGQFGTLLQQLECGKFGRTDLKIFCNAGFFGKAAVSEENGYIRGTVDTDMGSFPTPTSSCRGGARSPDVSTRQTVTHTPLPSCPNSLARMALPW